MGWMAPWAIGEATAYPDGLSREQHLDAGAPPSAAWVAALGGRWRSVFLAAGLVEAAGAALYVALGSGTVQSWVPREGIGASVRRRKASTDSLPSETL